MAALDENPPTTWGEWNAAKLREAADYFEGAKLSDFEQEHAQHFIDTLVFLKRDHEERQVRITDETTKQSC